MKALKPALSAIALCLSLAACTHTPLASDPTVLRSVAEARRILGEPALRWSKPDGGEQLAFPQGPMGYRTWMMHTDADGRVLSMENVMSPAHFARIQPGMSQDEVLRILGPSYPGWTVYYKARDELVWEWRYCDVWAEPARFDVLFDGRSATVRSTASQPERLSQPWGRGDRRDWCSP